MSAGRSFPVLTMIKTYLTHKTACMVQVKLKKQLLLMICHSTCVYTRIIIEISSHECTTYAYTWILNRK